MNIKPINYILLVILVGIITAIVIEEIKYNRFDRNDWSCYASIDKSNEPIEIIDAYFSNKNGRYECPKLEHGSNLFFHSTYYSNDNDVKFQLPPDSIQIKWFSYPDNTFYSIKSKIATQKITDYLAYNNFSKYDLLVHFKQGGYVDLFISEDIILKKDSLLLASFIGKKYDTKWEFGDDRPSDVYIMNSKVVMFPELYIKSDSKFRRLTNYYTGDINLRTDTLSGIFPDNKTDFLEKKKPFNSFSIVLENKKRYNDELLRVDVEFSTTELAEILKQLSKKEIVCSVKLTPLDSIESIFISDSNKKFQLKKHNVSYERVSYHSL